MRSRWPEPILLTDWELWAVANNVIDQHGERAPLFVVGRIGLLAAKGDEAGVATWKEVARRVMQLTDRPPGDRQS
jgi:hypothetical protein